MKAIHVWWCSMCGTEDRHPVCMNNACEFAGKPKLDMGFRTGARTAVFQYHSTPRGLEVAS